MVLDEVSDSKLEFVDGVVRGMASESEAHGSLRYNLPRVLGPLTDARGCRGYTSDTRVRVGADDHFAYPDLTIACPKGQFAGTSLSNPNLVVEVLSPSTEAYNRNRELDLYLSMASLEEYVMIHSETVRVERYRRHGEVWLYESVIGGEIEMLGGRLALADLYRNVEIPP